MIEIEKIKFLLSTNIDFFHLLCFHVFGVLFSWSYRLVGSRKMLRKEKKNAKEFAMKESQL